MPDTPRFQKGDRVEINFAAPHAESWIRFCYLQNSPEIRKGLTWIVKGNGMYQRGRSDCCWIESDRYSYWIVPELLQPAGPETLVIFERIGEEAS